MFAKLARFRTFNRTVGRRFGAAATPCNDNQPVRRFIASSRQLRRPVLLCRWHKAPTGALECSWHLGAIAASNAEEPGISRPIGRIPAVKPELGALLSFFFRPCGAFRTPVEHCAARSEKGQKLTSG